MNRPGQSAAATPFPRARSFAWMGLLFLAFVVYGSLAPFDFRAMSVDDAREAFGRMLSRELHRGSLSDLVANILLMAPVSFCLMGALGVDRPRWLAFGDLFFVLPACVAVSFAVEFAQLYLPDRSSALEDVFAQTGGAVLGALLWCVAGQKAAERARRFWDPQQPVRLDARLLPAYLFVLALVHVVPLSLITSPVELYHKYKNGLINLVPFRYSADEVFQYAEGRLVAALYFFLLGLLLPGLPQAFWRDRKQIDRVAFWSLMLVAGVTGLKLLVAGRGFDVTDLIVGALACLVGWEVSLSVRRSAVDETRGAVADVARWGGLVLWLALVTFVTWQPFDFDFSRGEKRLLELPLIPFIDALRGDPLTAFASVVQKMVMYLPLGVLVTTWRPTPVRFAWLPALLGGVVVAATLEAGQLFLSRTATLTDVYLEVAAAVLGSVITRRMCLGEAESLPIASLSSVKPTPVRGPLAW